MKNKILSLILTLCMLLGLFPYAVLGTAAYTTDDAGTIHLTSADDVLALMNDSSLWDKDIVLDANVDLAEASGQAPIGNSTTVFSGTFDGQNHTVSGVNISGTTGVGFFGKAGLGATIKNLTVKGTVTATGNASGGLIGWGVVPLTIQNCTNRIDVTGTNRAGGFVGSMDLTNAADLTVTGCVNYGTVTASGEHGGGLFGRLYKTENNQTTVITDCANYGDVTANTMAGGLVGRYESSAKSTVGDTTITRFANHGTISAPGTTAGANVGGAFGLFTNNATSKTTISEIYNTGSIHGTGATKYVGGICGYFRSYKSNVVSLSDCMNVGTIRGESTAVGGVIGTGNGSSGVISYTHLYNAGSVTAATQSFVKPIAGAIHVNSKMTGCYYSSTDNYTSEANSYEVATYVTPATTVAENAELFPVLAASDAWTITTTGPELTAFHTHVDADANGICDACELPMPESCSHTSTHTVTTPATCISTGVTRVICDTCATTLSETTLEIDPTNHAGTLTLSMTDGKISYACSCGATYTETTEPLHEISVGKSGVATLPDASVDTFADFALAMRYAALVSTAEQGVTIRIADDSAAITGIYTTPAFEGMITVTGGRLTHGGAGNRRFILNGDMTFEHLNYVGNSSSLIVAQNHKLVMGEGIETAGDIYIVGGAQDTTVGGVLDSDVTIRSGSYYLVVGANRHDYENPAAGMVRLTVGKTNADDTLTITQFFPFSVSGGTLSATSRAVVRIDGDAVIDQLYANIHPGRTVYTEGVQYIVDFILTGDIQNADSSISGGVNLLYEMTAGTNSAVGVFNVYNMDVPGASDASMDDAGELLNFAHDNITVNLKTGAEYCVDYNGGHADTDEDGVCDKCGASMACDHLYYHNGTVIPATCASAGSEEHICDDCGILFETVELPIDSNNHVGTDYVWHPAEDGSYYYSCAGCGEKFADMTGAPVVYIDGVNGDDANDGLTDATEVKTLEEAVKRLSEVGGTVCFTARVNVTDNITLPAYAKPITFTGTTDASGNANAGFVIQKNDAVLTLGGETILDTFVFKAEGGANLIISADWNDVTFGYIRVHNNATVGLYAGNYVSAADDTETKSSVINLHGAVITSDCAGGHVFYKTVALGTWFGTDGQTVSNKTVTLNADNGTAPNGTVFAAHIGTLYTMSSTNDVNKRHCYTPSCASVVNLNGETIVTTLRSGDRNVNGSASVTDAPGYLDSLVLNFNDNSTLGATAALRNVKNATVVVSNESEGRTTAITRQIQFQAFGLFAADGTVGQIKAVYGEHGFAASLTAPIMVLTGHEASYQLSAAVAPEHIWDDGVVTVAPSPVAPGEMTYTCTVCGKTKTEEIAFACTYHQWIPAEDGYVCAVCGTTAEALSAPTAMRVESVTIENGTATVVLSLESSAPFSALHFRVNVPEGFTYASHTSTLDDVSEDVDTSTLTGLSFACGTETMAVLYIKDQDLASLDKTNFVTLVYTVADAFTAETATVTLDMLEAYNFSLEALDVDAVGYVWKTSAHTHEYTASVTKEATCGENGVMTYTCVCGDSYTEVIPATGEHQYGEWVETKPAEPGAAGEETRTCTVCGHTETRATEPLPENYVAYIGETGYATVQAAMDAANVLDTVTVVKGTVETVTPSKTVYLAGDYSGVTISGDYTLDVTGRYALVDGEVVTDSTIEYVPLAVKAIVRPTTTGTIAKPNLSTNLGLGSSIEYKFNSKITYVEGFADFYVKLELLGLDGKSVDEGSTDDTARTLIITDHVVQGDAERYTYVFDGIPAKCMNNTIRYTAYAVREDGSVETLVYNWGAYVYLQKQLPTATGELKDLLVALINYGALAQQYRDYNTENLISDLLDEADRRLSTEDFAELEMTKIVNGTPRTNDGDLFKSFASSLQLYDKIKVIASVSAKNTSVTEYSNVSAVYSYPDSISGETITKVVPFEKWSYNATSKKYEINMDDISAKDLRQLISFNIYADYGTDVQTSVYAIENLTFNSAENYCATQRTSSDVNLAALCCGIIHYSDMAKAYLGAK